MLKKFSKEERSWILYDVANSAYILIVVTTLFPILFMNIAMADGVPKTDASAYTQYAKSIYSIIIAVSAPILGTYGDFKGKKKKMFLFFITLGIVCAFLLAIPNLGWQTILIIYIFATLGFAGANIFYDAFLVDVTDDDNMDRVSSNGFAWGYIGSLVPFVAGMGFYALAKFNILSLDENIAINIAFFIAALWWGLFSIPIIKNVKQIYYIENIESPVKNTFVRLRSTLVNIFKYKKTFVFLIAYFFYIDAVATIISAAIPIGKALEIVDDILLVGIVFVIQLVAFPCAIIFGILTKKYGAEKMIPVGIIIYILICIIGTNIHNAIDMWILAVLVAFAQGGIQSISRSHYGRLIPKESSNEFFGFYNIFGKFAAILGPIIVGTTIQMTDNPRYGMLAIMPLLIIGLIFFIISTKLENAK